MAQVQGAGEMDGQIDLAVPWFELQSRPMAVQNSPHVSDVSFRGENRNKDVGKELPSPSLAGLGFWPVISGRNRLGETEHAKASR